MEIQKKSTHWRKTFSTQLSGGQGYSIVQSSWLQAGWNIAMLTYSGWFFSVREVQTQDLLSLLFLMLVRATPPKQPQLLTLGWQWLHSTTSIISAILWYKSQCQILLKHIISAISPLQCREQKILRRCTREMRWIRGNMNTTNSGID